MLTASQSLISSNVIAGIVAILTLGHTACADVVEAAYGGSTSFNYVLTGMDDLDQRRDALPNDGNYYCVPTSTYDMMAYIASHGFPQVAPGDHPWQSQALYPTATGNIGLMGFLMGTSANSGTNGNGLTAGTLAWLGSNRHLFNVNTYSKTSSWAPTIAHLAEAATSGKLVNFTYGRYQYLSQNANTAFVAGRTGGHRVTLVRAARSGDTIVIGVRDPADEPDKPDPDNPQPDDNPDWLTTQSPFSTRVYNQARNVRVISPTNGFDRTMTAMRFPLSNPSTNSKFALIDSFMTISPKYGVTYTNTDTLKILAVLQDSLLGFSQQGSSWTVPPGAIIDLVPSPDDSRFAFVHQLLLAPASATLQVLNPSTGGISTVDSLPGAAGLVYGRGRELYVLQRQFFDQGTNRIACLDVETDPDILPDPIIETADLPGSYMAITYSDMHDRVIVLSGIERSILQFGAGLESSQAVESFNIPAGLLIGNSTGSIAVNPADGEIWFSTLVIGSSSVHNVRPGASPTEPPVFTSIPIPGATSVSSISFDDVGHMYVSTDVGLVEMAENGGQWEQVQNPYFDDAEIGPRFQVSCSRTNFDTAEHTGPEWFNVDPDENTEGVIIVDCPGDFDDDRDVDVTDLLAMLGAWGPCDICLHDLDRDRAIGVVDLLTLLARWGDCPE